MLSILKSQPVSSARLWVFTQCCTAFYPCRTSLQIFNRVTSDTTSFTLANQFAMIRTKTRSASSTALNSESVIPRLAYLSTVGLLHLLLQANCSAVFCHCSISPVATTDLEPDAHTLCRYETRTIQQRFLSTGSLVFSPNGGFRNLSVVTSQT